MNVLFVFLLGLVLTKIPFLATDLYLVQFLHREHRIDVAHQSPKHEVEMREKWKWKWKSWFIAVAI